MTTGKALRGPKGEESAFNALAVGCNEIFLHRSCRYANDLPQMPQPVVEEFFEASRFLECAEGNRARGAE